MKPSLLIATACITAALMSLPAVAGSEEETACPAGTPPGTICLEPRDIIGEVHRPSAMYVIDRGRLVHERQRADQSFTDEVIESVGGDPF